MEQTLQNFLQQIKEEILSAQNDYELNNVKAKAIGKKSRLSTFMQGLKNLPPEQKPAMGKMINDFKVEVERLLFERQKEIEIINYNKTLQAEAVDLTMPGFPVQLGGMHPLSQIRQEIEDIFIALGFDVVEGPDIDDEYHNFDALNTPPDHPARNEVDTFYLKQKGKIDKGQYGRLLLRSQTSTVQVRTMEKYAPPIKMISIGRCYRNDKPDASHSPFFHQVEGLCIDETITFNDLREVLNNFAAKMFGKEIVSRFRPHFFPFTEPSAEFDILCFNCLGKGCQLCKNSGWIEIGGAGMVDPNVFNTIGIDSEKYIGYAFGLGIDRITMLKHRIPDIRVLFENDIRFLKQFSGNSSN